MKVHATMTESVNATRAFLGDESRWSAVRVELDNVQGLWGGIRVWAAGDGRVIATTVLRGGVEQRRALIHDRATWRELMLLLIECDAVAIDPPERSGIPDEARPCLALFNADGRAVRLSKWAGVADERFDRVQAAVAALARSLDPCPPVGTPAFRPD
jgi:hypothetical protein